MPPFTQQLGQSVLRRPTPLSTAIDNDQLRLLARPLAPRVATANPLVELTSATIMPIGAAEIVLRLTLRLTNKSVVAHWMVALNADVGGVMLETEPSQHPDAALVPELDHRTKHVAIKPVPDRLQSNSPENTT